MRAAELHRIYPAVADAAVRDAASGNGAAMGATSGATVWRLQLEAAEQRIADRDAQIADRDDQITDLRRRLDQESEERRRVQAQLTTLLTDQRATTPPVAERPASAWGRFLAWRRGGDADPVSLGDQSG